MEGLNSSKGLMRGKPLAARSNEHAPYLAAWPISPYFGRSNTYAAFAMLKIPAWITYLLLAFVIGDLAFSYVQHLQYPIDGDLPSHTMPAPWYSEMLSDPLALSALKEGKRYNNPNRFTVHAITVHYFRNVPRWLQGVVDPLDSPYVASALLKIVIQIIMMGCTLWWVMVRGPATWQEVTLVAALITPFFQTFGFYDIMGMVDAATTYAVFYSLTVAFLWLLFVPFYVAGQDQFRRSWSPFLYLLMLPFAWLISVAGPIGSPVLIITSSVVLLYYISPSFKELINPSGSVKGLSGIFAAIPRPILIVFPVCILLGLYSLYIGTFNAENPEGVPGLLERYKLLFKGIWHMLTYQVGLPMLVIGVIWQSVYVLRKGRAVDQVHIRRIMPWILLGITIFILLLPLGGYRIYRPLIIRRDLLMPVTLTLIGLYGLTAWYTLKAMPQSTISRAVIIGLMLIWAAVFMGVAPLHLGHNRCERESLARIQQASEVPVSLSVDCTVLSWGPYGKPEESYYSALLLQHWGITSKHRPYFMVKE